MTEEEAKVEMQELARRATTAVLAFTRFMNVEYPLLASRLKAGMALEQPVRDAVAALNAHTLAWPDIPVPVSGDLFQRPGDVCFGAPSAKH